MAHDNPVVCLNDIPKDIAKLIAGYAGSFFSLSSINRRFLEFFKEERQNVISQGKIIPGINSASFFLTFEGEVYAAGFNKYGQLGVGDKEPRSSWTKTGPVGKKIIRVFNKLGITVAFCNDGSLYACGINQFGEMGLGDKEDKIQWVQMGPSHKKILDVQIEHYNIFVRCEDGWYGCGRNAYGALGTGDVKERLEWIEIKVSGKSILELIATENHTFVYCEDGWYSCGLNYSNSVSQNKEIILEWIKILPPEKTVLKLFAYSRNIFVCCEDGWYTRVSHDASKWVKIEFQEKNILELCTDEGGFCTYIRTEAGWFGRGSPEVYSEVTGIGVTSWGEIKLENKKIFEVKSPNAWSVFIRCEDEWYGRGQNSDGQFGVGEAANIEDWVKIGSKDKKIVKFYTNNNNSFVLCEDGWYACGSNGWGQLATGDTLYRKQWTKILLPHIDDASKNEQLKRRVC